MNLLINLMLFKTDILNRLTDNNFISFVDLLVSSSLGKDPFYFFVTMNLILFLPEVLASLMLILLIKNRRLYHD